MNYLFIESRVAILQPTNKVLLNLATFVLCSSASLALWTRRYDGWVSARVRGGVRGGVTARGTGTICM